MQFIFEVQVMLNNRRIMFTRGVLLSGAVRQKGYGTVMWGEQLLVLKV